MARRHARQRFRRPWLCQGSACQTTTQNVKSHSSNLMMLLSPPLPPGGPAHSAGPTPNLQKPCFWALLGGLFSIFGRLFSIFGRFLRALKIIKKRQPKNMPQNLKSRTSDRPNIDLGITFGIHFGIDFHEILDFVIISENHRNDYI